MFFNIIFILSGLVMVSLVIAKILEEKSKGKPALLRLVSLGDERVRKVTVEFAHLYADWREKINIYLTNQLPLRTKNLLNKVTTVVKEKFVEHVGDIRGSKFLKKSDGISEYFKNISEKESEGRIDDEIGNSGEGSQKDGSRVE